MKRLIINAALASLVAIFGAGFFAINTYAEDENSESSESSAPKTSLTLMPVSNTMSIASNETYKDTMTVSNDGSDDVKVEVYAAPYSYVYSESEDLYKLGFSSENKFTQISRWITIKDADGNYVDRATFTIPKGETLSIKYKVTTPDNIPAGGQYAVIFVQTVSGNVNASGIRTEASAGMVLYGHSSEGVVDVSAEIRDLEITQGGTGENGESNNNFHASAKVKNVGNVDFFAKGVLKVEPIIGFGSYETEGTGSTTSVIPESERIVEDEWKETPDFGLYKVTWTVTAGEESETIDRVVFLVNPAAVIITIIILTIIVVCIIIGVRKRKERRSRLAV